MIPATRIFEQGTLRSEGGKENIHFKANEEFRQHDLQTDRVGEPIVCALRLPEFWSACSRRPLNTSRETNSAKLKIVLTPRSELSNPNSRESGYPREGNPHVQRRRRKKSRDVPLHRQARSQAIGNRTFLRKRHWIQHFCAGHHFLGHAAPLQADMCLWVRHSETKQLIRQQRPLPQ